MFDAVELSHNSPASPGPSPTLRELAALLFRHTRLIAITFAAVFLSVLLYAFLSPRYEAHLRILVRRGRSDPLISPQATTSLDFTREAIGEEELNSEAELMRDDELLKEVVEAAQLVPAETSFSRRPVEVERQARRLARRLSVEPVRKSNLIQATYRSNSPAQAARVLSSLAAVYLLRHAQLQRPSGEFRFFAQQTADSERRLRDSEDRLVGFTRASGVASATLERDIALQRLGEAEATHRQISLDRADTEHRIAALNQQLAAFPKRSLTQMRSADNPELLGKLKTQLLELLLKRTALLTRFEPSYRLVQEVDQQIAATRNAINNEGLTPLRDETTDKDPNYEWARMELERAQVQRESLRAREVTASEQIAALRQVAQQRQSDSVAQQNLARTTKADEDNFLLYRRKREEARIGDALDEKHILNAVVVQPPVAPALPVHSILFYFLLSFAGSCAFALGAAFAAERFDPTIRTLDEAHGALEIPVLAWLPASDIVDEATELPKPRKVAGL